MYLQNMRNGDT